MKPSTLHALFLAAGSSLLAISSVTAQTTYTWDIDAAAGVTGGTGAWNTTNTLWTTDAGATNTYWVNAGAAPFNNAVFGGTVGTVTLDTWPSRKQLSALLHRYSRTLHRDSLQPRPARSPAPYKELNLTIMRETYELPSLVNYLVSFQFPKKANPLNRYLAIS